MSFRRVMMSMFIAAMPFWAISISATEGTCRNSTAGEFQAKRSIISLDFSMHRPPDDLAVFDAIINGTESLTSEVVGPFQNWIMKRNAFMKLSDQIRSAEKLSTLIKNHQIAWIGVEYSPSEIGLKDSLDRDGVARFSVLKAALKTAKVREEIATMALILYAGSPARFVWYSEDDVRQSVRLVPLDSDSLKADSQKMVLDLLPTTGTLETALKYFSADKSKIGSIFTRIDEVARSSDDKLIPSLIAELNDFGDLIQIVRIVFPDIKDLTEFINVLIKEKRRLNKNQKLRDAYVAKVALLQSGNGWISFGPSHAENLEKELEIACTTGESR